MRKNFSLIELLIVIAIIAIIAAMLLPTLNKARSTAHASSCINKLKQIGLSSFAYADAYAGFLPVDAGAHYYTFLSNAGGTPYYPGITEFPRRLKHYYCPSGPEPQNGAEVYGIAYRAIGNLTVKTIRLLDPSRYFAQIYAPTNQQPSSAIMYADSLTQSGTQISQSVFINTFSTALSTYKVSMRHANFANGWFIDGHVTRFDVGNCDAYGIFSAGLDNGRVLK